MKQKKWTTKQRIQETPYFKETASPTIFKTAAIVNFVAHLANVYEPKDGNNQSAMDVSLNKKEKEKGGRQINRQMDTNDFMECEK